MTTGGVRTTNHAYGVRHEFDVVHGKEEALSTAEDLVYSRIAESAGHQSHPNLSFEAATIIALICVHRPIAVHELLYKIGVLFPYWGVKVAAALVHRRDAGYYDQTPSEQLKDTLCQYDLPFKVWREDPSGTIFCDVTSTDEAMCVLRKLLPPRALEYQFKALLRRQRVHPRVDTIDPPQVAITKQLTHQGYSVLVDGATGRATIIPVLPLSAASSARTAPTYLLRLPAEMRNEIYKLVLQYAKSGIRIADSKEDTNGPKKKYVFTQTRDIKSDARTSSWGYRSEDFAFSQHQSPLLRSYPLETAIALLLVNKQIRNEAGPIFYGANRFHFDNLYEFVGFTKTLNMKNFGKNFQQVALNYEVWTRDVGQKAVLALCQSESL